jgi:hypothetical protein
VVRDIDPDHWNDLDSQQGEFVSVMNDADEGSFSYRYPVNKQGEDAKRPAFIDLQALERHAERFEGRVQGYTDWIDEMRGEERYYLDQADPGY